MKPDASLHRPDPAYLRQLVAATGMTQAAAGARLGVSARQMRRYLTDGAGATPAPYLLQYGLERLAAG